MAGTSPSLPHSAEAADPRVRRAQALLANAREQGADQPNVRAFVEATEALLDTLAEVDDQHRSTLADICHQFVDLSRSKSLRRAAYDANPDGGWIDSVIRLIEQSDFTVGRMFRQRAAQHADKTLFKVPHGEQTAEYSWQRVREITCQLAGGIRSVLGDDPVVALYTPNRVEGALVDLACLTNGIFNAVVPANSVASQVEQILNESGAGMLVVSGAAHLKNALAATANIPGLECVVTLEEVPKVPGIHMMSYRELLEAGGQVSPDDLVCRLDQVHSRDTATTMYTSGTTGKPKGIKFSHLNLVSKRYARAAALPDLDENEVFLCFLPLYHTFGRWLEMLGCVHLGATYVFAEDPSTETLISHMQRFKPTAMISVPKKWRDIYDRICGGDPSDDPQKHRREVAKLTGGRLRWGLSAAGRLDPDIFRFYQRNGVDLLSGYGMTEATGGITMTPPGSYLRGSIGRALPGIELGFGDDGELLLRGPYVTDGYTDPADTLASFRDGWLHTGDIVRVDKRGFLWHVDRKKDIYKNASGRTIAPQRIEGLFADFPEVSRVFAVGDGRDYVTLLIRPDFDCPEVQLRPMTAEQLREYFRGLVVSCNRFLAPFERVVNFALLDRDFSTDRQELTFKGSFRRATVEESFREVIEPMYAAGAIERRVDGLRVKIPVAFLQQLGATETGTQITEKGLEFRAIDKTLPIRRDAATTDRVWIGNCCYTLASDVVDLDEWLRRPELWVGNADLTHVTGENILVWSLAPGDQAASARMVDVGPPQTPVDEWRARVEAPGGGASSLLTIHAAASVLNAGSGADGGPAVSRLARVLASGLERHVGLAERQLQFAAQHPIRAVRGQAFVTLYEHQPANRFAESVRHYLASLPDFLDDTACARIAEIGLKPEHWQALAGGLASLRRELTADCTPQQQHFSISLLRSLAKLPSHRWSFYRPVTCELTAWLVAPLPQAIQVVAEDLVDDAAMRFRESLGPVQATAVDPDTGREYTWGETLRFENGIDSDELDRMANAIQHTRLVREAIYLFYDKRLIDLPDVSPSSVWVSLLTTRFGRSVYRVTLRLRSGERCDFALLVQGRAPDSRFRTGLRLMSIVGDQPGEAPLVARLGGYWPEYRLASAEFIADECLDELIRPMHDHPDREVRQRLKESWTHLAWSALTAAFDLYRRTQGQWVLAGTLHRHITVPLNDYEANVRLLSVSGARPFTGCLNTILRLKHEFLDLIRFKYPSLAADTPDELIFDAVLESLGQQEGLAFLNRAITEAGEIDAPAEETAELGRAMAAYAERLGTTAYTPKAVCCAIARFRAWMEQVPKAAAHARAAQLRELQASYGIDTTVRKFPGARLQLYAETVLKDVPADGRQTIERSIRRLREGHDLKQVLGRLYTDLQAPLDSHDLRYFLTRAAYPHLDLDEKAELVTISQDGADRLELVTQHTDKSGRALWVRPVANSREVDVLHRIFYLGGLRGGGSATDQLLVIVDQADYVIGGISYVRRTPTHVLLDKIAVLHRFQGCGIGRLLLNEFTHRLQAEGVSIISAQFIRRDLLDQFGFKSNPRYAGLVLPLS